MLADTICTTANEPIDEKGFVRIGGMDQWVRIKGSSCANPIIVLIHGGPGNPTTPFADAVYQPWEQHYTIVQWDQRGAGMTYGRTPLSDDVPLRVEQLRDDGIEVSRYAARRFGKKQVILMGGSWSSVLGVNMAKADPAMFCGYISSSQLVDKFGQNGSYSATLARARRQRCRFDRQARRHRPAAMDQSAQRRHLAAGDRQVRAAGDHASAGLVVGDAARVRNAQGQGRLHGRRGLFLLQFVGMKGDGIGYSIDLYQLGPKFAVPFYMVQGQEDLLTMADQSRRYFDFIEAPRKQFVLVPAAGHDPNPPMLAAQYKLLRENFDRCE